MPVLVIIRFFELPRRLATVLPTPYSYTYLQCTKDTALRYHSGFPCHPFGHCKVFAPAAPRGAWLNVSEAISGLSLSRPVQIIALLSSYLNNELIRRSPILRHIAALGEDAFQQLSPIGYYAQFPKIISVLRAG